MTCTPSDTRFVCASGHRWLCGRLQISTDDDDDDDVDGCGRRKVMLSNCVKWVIFVLVAFRRWVLTSFYAFVQLLFAFSTIERAESQYLTKQTVGNSNQNVKWSWTRGLMKIPAKMIYTWMTEYIQRERDTYVQLEWQPSPTEPNKRSVRRTGEQISKQITLLWTHLIHTCRIQHHTPCVRVRVNPLSNVPIMA